MRKMLPLIIAVLIAMPMAINATNNNNPPEKPVITGPTEGEAGKTYTYTVVSTDPDGDKIYYCIDWGDGNEFCTDLMESGKEYQASHAWQEKGTYVITVTATDEHGATSEPATLQVKMPFVMTMSYTGRLRIYVVEPVSRWYNDAGNPYNFGFLDFAYDDTVSVDYMEEKTINVEWNPSEAGYSDVSPDNIMAIAAVFNPTPHEGHAYPPFSNPFDAYYVDACAAAMPGGEGENVKQGSITHTVLVEVGTATWCPYCPYMDETLKKIYDKGELPFYIVALIADKNQKAYERLINDYNLYGYPTAFFDGGRKVLVGGIDRESPYENAISYCMQQDVHDLDLKIKCDWQNGKLKVEVKIKNLESGDVTPPDLEVIKPKDGYLYLFDREIMKLPLQFALIVGKITLKVEATDDIGIEKVVFSVCGEILFEDTEPPYEYIYDGTFGSHLITIEAYDTSGNVASVDIPSYVINL